MTTIPESTSWPAIVSEDEWKQSQQKHLKLEKALTRMRDSVAASRKRLPMMEITTPYEFEGEHGKASLLDLFGGHRQLILQHFMFHPDWDAGCDGCSMMADHVGPLAHMQARDTTYVAVARAPIQKLIAFKARMGWKFPFYSSFGTTFNQDFGVSFFVRNGDRVFRTGFNGARGIEDAISTFALLDHTVFGRQELFEDSPAGWPQTESYSWWKRHDEYDSESTPECGCHS